MMAGFITYWYTWKEKNHFSHWKKKNTYYYEIFLGDMLMNF